MEHHKKQEEVKKKESVKEDKGKKEDDIASRLTLFGQSTRHTSPDGQEIGYFSVDRTYSTMKERTWEILHSRNVKNTGGSNWDYYKTIKQVEAYVKKLDGWKQWSRNNPL
jgi:hypothetical protein